MSSPDVEKDLGGDSLEDDNGRISRLLSFSCYKILSTEHLIRQPNGCHLLPLEKAFFSQKTFGLCFKWRLRLSFERVVVAPTPTAFAKFASPPTLSEGQAIKITPDRAVLARVRSEALFLLEGTCAEAVGK